MAVIQAAQAERDRSKLASRTLTLREKDRVRATRFRAGAPPLEPRSKPKSPRTGHFYLGGERTSLLGFDTRGYYSGFTRRWAGRLHPVRKGVQSVSRLAAPFARLSAPRDSGRPAR